LFAELLQQKSFSDRIVRVVHKGRLDNLSSIPGEGRFFILLASSCRPNPEPTQPPTDLMPKVKQEGSCTSTLRASLWDGFTFTCITGQTIDDTMNENINECKQILQMLTSSRNSSYC
jgi:hypothetical protein